MRRFEKSGGYAAAVVMSRGNPGFFGKVATTTQLKNEARWMLIVRDAFRKFQFVKHEFPPWIGDQYMLNL